MTYPGAAQVAESRKLLGDALEALQQDPDIPADVLQVAEYIAAAVRALFEAERASSAIDGKASVQHAMGSLGQSMAMLQDVSTSQAGVEQATRHIAQVLSQLYPLSSASVRPEPPAEPEPSQPPPAPGDRHALEANVGATTESNFFVGFSGEVSDGGVFIATYLTLPVGTKVQVLVTLPGGFSKTVLGTVRFVRDPMDLDSEPGMGIGFEKLDSEARELVMRFIRKRAPLFYDE